MKEMAGKLAKAVEDQSFFKDLLLAGQERSGDLAQELAVLQEQQRTKEKTWSNEVSSLRGQRLVHQ